jgi:hypothetical protein
MVDESAVKKKTFVLNFGHALALDVLEVLAPALEIKVPLKLELDSGSTPVQVREAVGRAAALLHEAGGALDGTVPLLVGLPGLTEGAALILAELHGRLGGFPRVLALRRRADGIYSLAQMPAVQVPCGRCQGTGAFLVGGRACYKCGGTGRVEFPALGGVIDLERVRNAARERR